METIKLIKCPKCGNYMHKVSENTGGYLFECGSCPNNSIVSPDGYIQCSYEVFKVLK